jgi:hypothetical protein
MKRLLLISTVFIFSVAKAQLPEDINLTEFVQEGQKFNNGGGRMQMVWWIPLEYWEVLGRTNPGAASQLILWKEYLKDYTLIVAVDGKQKVTGAFDFKSDSLMRPNIKLNYKQKMYQPLKYSELSSEALMLEDAFKPLFGKILGPMGEGMQIYFFKVDDNSLSAVKEGSFEILFDKSPFNWNLPLNTLLPPKYCPVDKAKLKGGWKFCPYHGNELK